MIVKNLIELIGKTPMLEVQPGLLLKLERFNPGGSVKDRTALSMIEDAEKRGVLHPGGTIIDGENYQIIEQSVGKRIFYGILRILIIPFRHLL